MKKLNIHWAAHTILILLCFIMIYPVFWWIGTVFKPPEELTSPSFWPKEPTLDNFTQGWHAITNYSFGHFYLNSFQLVGIIVFTTILSCSLVAFGFARLKFPLRNFWFSIVLMTLMLPTQVTIIPQYVMFSKLDWLNTYLPLIVPNVLAIGVSGPFSIFLLVQFIRGIPNDLDEAARIDGCSSFGIYWRIILPLLTPAIITMSIFTFLWNWDDFLGHMIYIQSISQYTVSLALKLFVDAQSSTPWGQLFAMSLLSVLPGAIVFFFAQKYIVDGIATTGLKG